MHLNCFFFSACGARFVKYLPSKNVEMYLAIIMIIAFVSRPTGENVEVYLAIIRIITFVIRPCRRTFWGRFSDNKDNWPCEGVAGNNNCPKSYNSWRYSDIIQYSAKILLTRGGVNREGFINIISTDIKSSVFFPKRNINSLRLVMLGFMIMVLKT